MQNSKRCGLYKEPGHLKIQSMEYIALFSQCLSPSLQPKPTYSKYMYLQQIGASGT